MTPSPFRCIPTLVLAILPLATLAAPIPIEFENASFVPDGQDGLPGWQSIGHAQGNSHEFIADRKQHRSAPASARIKRTGPEPWGLLAQLVTVKPEWVGKTVRLSGHLRSAGATGTGGGLVLQATNGSGSVLVHDHMEGRQVRGDQDWTSVATQVKVPSGAYFLKLGVMLIHDGTLWADDLKLELMD